MPSTTQLGLAITASAKVIDPNTEFFFYDYWDIYNPNKIYDPDVFEAVLHSPTSVKRKYRYRLFIFADKHYVVANECPDPDELRTLQRYCKCKKCRHKYRLWYMNKLCALDPRQRYPVEKYIKLARQAQNKKLRKLNN